jgi:predicted HicB family RNase H-like nuclease
MKYADTVISSKLKREIDELALQLNISINQLYCKVLQEYIQQKKKKD